MSAPRTEIEKSSLQWGSLRTLVPVLFVALVGLIGAVGSFGLVRRAESRAIENEFSEYCQERLLHLQEGLKLAEADLLSLADFPMIGGSWNEKQFRRLTARLLNDNDAFQAIQWRPRVRGDDREAFENAVRADGRADYRIREVGPDGRIVPVAKRSEYFAVRYVEPMDTFGATLGLDLASEPIRRHTLELARDSGVAVVSGRVLLGLDDLDRSFGVLLIAPVYQSTEEPISIEQRRASLSGFCVGVIHPPTLIRRMAQGMRTVGINLYLYDVGDDESFLGHHPSRLNPDPRSSDEIAAPDLTSGLHDARKIQWGGREWKIVFTTVPGYEASRRTLWPWFVLVIGLVATTTAGWLTNQARRRSQLLDHLVQERTSELVESNEQLYRSEQYLAITLQSIGDAVLSTDAQRRVIWLNLIAERLTGWSQEEAEGRSVEDVFRIINEETRQPGAIPVDEVMATGEVHGLANHTVLIARDGSERAIADSAAPIRDQQGRLLGVVLVFRDVTEERRAEKMIREMNENLESLVAERTVELRESERRYRLLFENNPHPMWVYDPQTLRFLAVNDTAVDYYGYSRQEFLSMTLADIRPAGDVEALRDDVSRSPIGYQHGRLWRHRLKDGRIIYVEISSHSLEFAGKPVRLVLSLDVTKRLEAERSLRASEANMAAAQRIAHFGSWELDLTNQEDLNANPLRWSDEMYRIAGFEPGEVEATNELFFQLTPPEIHETIRQAVATAIRERQPYALVHRLIRPSGEERIVHEMARVFYDEQTGQPLKMIGTAHDVTDRIRAEEAIRISEERFRLVSKATNDAVWDWDVATNALWWSEGFEVLFGYSRDEIEWSLDSWVTRIHPEDRQRVLDSLHHSIDQGETVWSGEYRFIRKDGRPAHVFDRGYVIRNDEGKPIRLIGGMTDLTERKALEAQLLQSQKMEAVGQLAGGVAHDFNNLLTVITGYTDILLSTTPANDPKRAMLADIREAGERAANLTRQLLAFSRKQVLAPQVLDLNDVVGNVEKMLRRLIGEDVRLTSVLQPNLKPIKVDPGQLEQVIINLAVNARDAMPTGGRLTIETANVEISGDEADRKFDLKPGSYVELSISDTGCGMTPEVKQRIFEPFFTTKEAGKGTGLGLATVFGIVKQSDGFIDVYSEVGIGTRFKMLFPANEAHRKPKSQYELQVRKGSETILLVEDEEGVRRMAKLALEAHGYKVLEAQNGQEAVAIIEKYTEPIHLVITDVVMPEMSGRELVEFLRRNRSTAKVLFMSGYTDDAVVRHGVIDATDAFLQKPFTPLTLTRKISELLG